MLEADTSQFFTGGGGNHFALQFPALQTAFHQILRDQQQYGFAVTFGFHQRIHHFRMHIQCLIRRDSPRCGSPDHAVTGLYRQGAEAECRRQFVMFGKREADINRRITFVFVFHFRFRERGAAIETPVHRFQTTINIAFFQQGAERTDFVRFVAEVHGFVRIIPFAQHTQTAEAGFLVIDLLIRVSAGFLDHFIHRQVFAVQFFDLNFDRHAVAIPARYIRSIKAAQCACFDNHVFQNFIDGVAQMDVTVCIRRAIVQDEFRTTGSGFAHTFVDFFILPLFYPVRFAFGQITAHRESRFGHIDRIFAGRFRRFLIRHN